MAGRVRRRVARASASPFLRVAVGTGARVDLLVGQDGVGVELLADLVDQLEARELQQANRLLQLRRHHELLTELELLLDLHRVPWTALAKTQSGGLRFAAPRCGALSYN